MIDLDKVGYYSAVDFDDFEPQTKSCVMEFVDKVHWGRRGHYDDLVIQSRRGGWFYGAWGKYSTHVSSPVFFSSRRVSR